MLNDTKSYMGKEFIKKMQGRPMDFSVQNSER